MINKDKFFERLGITPGEWESTSAWNYSGTLVACIINGNNETLFQSRHSDTSYTKQQCENDSKIGAASKEMLWTLLMGLPEFGDVGVVCPWCGNDLREKYTCEGCEIDHMGGGCYHEGGHEKDCMAIKIIESATGRTWQEIKDIVEECKE